MLEQFVWKWRSNGVMVMYTFSGGRTIVAFPVLFGARNKIVVRKRHSKLVVRERHSKSPSTG